MKNLKINLFFFFHFLPQFSTASLFLFSLFVEHLNQDNLKLQSELFSSEKPQNSNKEEIDEEKFVQLQEENTELHGLITSLRLREERVNADKKDCEDVLKLNEMLNKSLETKNAKIAECQEINRILDETLMMLRKDLQSQLMLQKKYTQGPRLSRGML